MPQTRSTYSDRELVRIDPHVDRPRQISVSGLDSIVKLLRNELDILRLDEDGNVGLFEADGGMWKMQAKASIVAYFEEKLADEISAGKVIVMM